MRPLSAHDIVRIWEKGQGKHALDRALLLLGPAFPELTQEQLARLSIGQRNARLLKLREQTLGAELNAFVECPNCTEQLEFSVDVASVRVAEIRDVIEETFSMTVDDFVITFRPVNSLDLATIVGLDDVELLRDLLMRRCVLSVHQGEERIDIDDLPEGALAALAEEVSECDPQAEVRLRLDCAKCEHSWSALFDIVSYFWIELTALADRLISDVNHLARAYGWRETDILSMSAVRRQSYLEKAG